MSPEAYYGLGWVLVAALCAVAAFFGWTSHKGDGQ